MFKRKYGPVATLSLLSGGLNIPLTQKPIKLSNRQSKVKKFFALLKMFISK